MRKSKSPTTKAKHLYWKFEGATLKKLATRKIYFNATRKNFAMTNYVLKIFMA